MARPKPWRIPRRDGWKDDALCREVDYSIFYPELGDNVAIELAKQVCGLCRVRERCLEDALTLPEHYGVWGGTSESERRRMLQQARG